MDTPQHSAGASRTSHPYHAVHIVAATKISHRSAQAASVTHPRSHSKPESSSKHNQDPACAAAGAAALPSPVSSLLAPPPPPSSLPPTPRFGSQASPDANGTVGTAQTSSGPLSKSIRRALRQISAGLTKDEHAQLVQKIILDLRPAQPSSSIIRPFSRPASTSAPTNKMPPPSQSQSLDSTPLITSKRLSVRSHSDDSSTSGYGSHSGEEKLSRTPPLSRSRTATPTTPASVLTHDKQLKLELADADKPVLTPTAALESLRVLENSFVPSTLSLPLEEAADAHDDDKLSLNTALASPTKSTAGDKDTTPSSPVSTGTISTTRPKRSSSYRKSVPTLDDLATRSKRPAMNARDRQHSSSSVSTASQPPLSPSSTYTQTSSWISSLTTSEAIRVLAFQQDSIEAGSDAEANTPLDLNATNDELSALRYALKYALARSDKLAEALSRANQDRIKAESELEILRNNVLIMLSSKSILRSPDSLKTRELHADHAKRPAVRSQTSEEEDTDHFEDAHSKHGHGAVERTNVSSPKKKQVSIDLEPRVTSAAPAAASLSRPPRAERTAADSKAVTPVVAPAAAEPAKPATGVSIASLRKKQAESGANASSSSAQRYTPSRKALDLASEPADTLQTDEDEVDDDEFDMFPFHQIRRRAAPEVSMADFLNASRMSKSEIEQHDARRELEREDDAGYSHSSHSSRAPLTGGLSARRGILKNLSKLVETERTKRNARRTSATIISKPSLVSINSVPVSRDSTKLSRSTSTRAGLLTSFSEESIIPTYPKVNVGAASTTAAAAEARLRALSINSSLRESLEKQSLWEAGIRA